MSTCIPAALRRLAATAVLGLLLSGAAQAASGPLLSQQLLRQIPEQAVDPLLAPPPAPAPSTALVYARSVPVDLDSRRHGRWQQDGDRAHWRLLLRSEDAVNLSVTLAELRLPAGAELRLYDGEGFLWQGPESAAQLRRHPRYWSALVPGERLLLELSVPAAAQADTHLAVTTVHHGFADIAGFKSGSCNVDTACAAADPWTDAVRATARITIGGQRVCSAVLLNNTRRNGDPLMLTARHCGVGENDDLTASSVRVYWNYETGRCGGDPNGSLAQNQHGSTLLAAGASADFTLIRLDQIPPAHFQVHYAGWDATGLAPTSGASVHHPSGDEKRISIFDSVARAGTANVDGEPVQSWEVRWDRGVTEAGSSGAGLWSSGHYVIGQLSGGNSSCDNPDGADVFGRLDVAWQENPQASGQLKAWLDPDNSGARRLDGHDSGAGGLSATPDSFTGLPADSQTLRLDVLANDGGAQPLQLIGASAGSGQVQVEDGHLVYRFAPDALSDQLSYQVIDRWGETRTVPVAVIRESVVAQDKLPLRGGAPGPLLLLIVLAGARGWRRR